MVDKDRIKGSAEQATGKVKATLSPYNPIAL
jgi:uncharacterized protein YjbJ (UPF0337 family)